MSAAKNNKFIYETSGGTKSGYFNIYQGRSGHLYLQMGNSASKLSLNQINEINIDCYSLKEFDHDDFNKAYNLPF